MITQLEAFTYTLALELPIVLAMGKYWGVHPLRSLPAGLIANCISHPVAWSIAIHMSSPTFHQYGWHVIEAGVCVFEAAALGWMMRLHFGQAILISLLANGVSAIVGRLITTT
jgi:hypothetical protein